MIQVLRNGRFGLPLDKMLEAALLISFFGLLRLGEFTSVNSKFDFQRDLRLADIARYDSFINHPVAVKNRQGWQRFNSFCCTH